MSNPEKQGNGKAKKFQGYRTNTYIHTPFVFIYLFWAFWHLGSGRSASVGVCEFMAKAPFQRKSKEKRLQYAHANTGETKGAYSSNGQLFSMGLISWFFPAALSGILSGSVSGFVSWDSSSLQTVQVLARPGLSMFSPELFFFLNFLWVVCSCGNISSAGNPVWTGIGQYGIHSYLSVLFYLLNLTTFFSFVKEYERWRISYPMLWLSDAIMTPQHYCAARVRATQTVPFSNCFVLS